jgi:hypothetical protein
MLAHYPGMIDADSSTQARLVAAWFRRKRLEARLIATEVGKLFGGEPQEPVGDEIDQDLALSALGIREKRVEVKTTDGTTG